MICTVSFLAYCRVPHFPQNIALGSISEPQPGQNTRFAGFLTGLGSSAGVAGVLDAGASNPELDGRFQSPLVEDVRDEDAGAVRLGASPYVGAVRLGASPYVGAVRRGASPSVGAVRRGASPYVGAVRLGASPYVGAVRRGASPYVGAVRLGASPYVGAVRLGASAIRFGSSFCCLIGVTAAGAGLQTFFTETVSHLCPQS